MPAVVSTWFMYVFVNQPLTCACFGFAVLVVMSHYFICHDMLYCVYARFSKFDERLECQAIEI